MGYAVMLRLEIHFYTTKVEVVGKMNAFYRFLNSKRTFNMNETTHFLAGINSLYVESEMFMMTVMTVIYGRYLCGV